MNLALAALAGKRTRSVESLSEERSSHSDSTEEALDIKGDQFSGNKETLSILNLSSYDMWALGLTTAIGGHYFAWNAGLAVGFGSFLIALFLIATGYLSLVLCIAELSSALPFAGGAYGIARVTLGIFPGYLVAVCDSYKSIVYVSTSVFTVGQIITLASKQHTNLQYLYWTVLFGFYLSVLTYGGRFYWRVNFALATLSVIILFIYIFGTIPFADFENNAAFPDEERTAKWFRGDINQFLQVLPLATRFFHGIQSINVACGQIENPKVEVPKGYIGAISTVLLTSFATLFLSASVSKPNLLTFIARARPLTSGFSQMFAIPRTRATILNLPATTMAGFGFMYYYGQQISAMGKSGLLNPIFGFELPGRGTPIVALGAGSLLAYMLCVIQVNYPGTQSQIYALSVLGATATNLSIFASFIMFRWYFPTIKREFTSPLGEYGAVYGALVFALCFISICGFQEDQVSIIVFAIIIAVASVYYYIVVKKRQVFSEEEKTVMFKAYLMKNNAAKAGRIRRGNATSSNALTGTASAGSAAGSATSSKAAAQQKKSTRIMSRVEVAPVNVSNSDPSDHSQGAPAMTPTSTTIVAPYRSPRNTDPAGSRRGSVNDSAEPVDVETGALSNSLESIYPHSEISTGASYEINPQRTIYIEP